jgi:plasmid stabilization system protein ParE
VTRRVLVVRSVVRADIVRYVRYLLEQDARAAAERFPDAVEQALEHLLDMPHMGALQSVTHPKLGAMRAWQVPGFRYMYIYYQEVPNGLRVVRILDARRNLRRIFAPKDKTIP